LKAPPYLATPLVSRRASSQPFRKRLKPEEELRRPMLRPSVLSWNEKEPVSSLATTTPST
jgi:hypothetical protein